MTTARYLVGDVFDQLDRMPPGSVDVVICSPPFLALRTYLPDSHPDKAREIGSEGTPAAFVDVLLRWTAAAGRVLAPHGSLVVELGDTYSGSGGAGGDYSAEGLRAGQAVFDGSAAKARRYPDRDSYPRPSRPRFRSPKFARVHDPDKGPPILDRNDKSQPGGVGWPLDKSLAGIPFAYMLSLAYGRNVLRAPLSGAEVLAEVDRLRQAGLAVDVAMDQVRQLVAEPGGGRSPAGRWRVRTVKAWIRSNPPVGALGDKERPATSYVVVATRDPDRYFDLDAVRTAHAPHTLRYDRSGAQYSNDGYQVDQRADGGRIGSNGGNPAGAPPRDWVHTVDLVLDAELAARAGRPVANRRNARGVDSRPNTHKSGHDDRTGGRRSTLAVVDSDEPTSGAQGVHLRRALERAGILTTLEALDVSPKGYAGAHYAVWPPELVRLLLAEMCPPRVCCTCGRPSRRIVRGKSAKGGAPEAGHYRVRRDTTGWSDCGHGTWRPGRVLDPFAGSGTTLAVASGMGFDSIGIDIDYRNASLAMDRVGMFLQVTWPPPRLDLPALGPGRGRDGGYWRWMHLKDDVAALVLDLLVRLLHGGRHDDPIPASIPARRGRAPRQLAGQTDLFPTPEETPCTSIP